MPVRRNIPETSGIYSITFTCTNWLCLFEIANAYSSVYNWFDVLNGEGHNIVGYTIMPNHLHAVIAFVNKGQSINAIISNGKRFMAYEIVDKLKQANNESVLTALANARNATEIKANKQHKVFETSFDWKHCNSDKMLEQKLSYIHSNPCKGKWNLANSPVDYVHSSARYYLTGEVGFYPVTHYKAIEEIDLHSLQQKRATSHGFAQDLEWRRCGERINNTKYLKHLLTGNTATVIKCWNKNSATSIATHAKENGTLQIALLTMCIVLQDIT